MAMKDGEHRFQVVLQFPEAFFPGLDDMFAFGEKLEASLPRTHLFDGHDVGLGTVNFFVYSNSPNAVLTNFRRSLGTLTIEKQVRIAYREVDGEDFTNLWPRRDERPFDYSYETGETAPISTRNLARLPGIEDLRRRMQSLAMLDAILCPDWDSRYYSFNQKWAPGAQMGSMRDGCGNELFAHFGPGGCWIKGFVHDCKLARPGKRSNISASDIVSAVPEAFAGCLKEPAFSVEDVTFCVWREPADVTWRMSPINLPAKVADPDGSEELLSAYDGRPETYAAWAAEYYDEEIDLDAVAAIYRHEPLTRALVKRLNPELGLKDLAEDLSEIGYPRSSKA